MLKKVADLTNQGPSKGLNTNHDILGIDKEESPNMMDVLVDFYGSSMKRLGSDTRNSVIIADSATAGFSPNSANFLNSSIQVFWKLDEATGTRFAAIGAPNLTDNNAVKQSGGIKNQAALFVSSSSQYLLAQNTAQLATGDIDFSLSTWFYLNSTGFRTLISKRESDISIDNSTILLLHMDGLDGSTTFTDSSPSRFAITVSGNAQVDTAQSKFGGASCLFDGTSDHLTAPTANQFRHGSGNFTYDFWVRFNGVAADRGLFGNGDLSTNRQLACRWAQAAASLRINYSVDGSNGVTVDFPWGPSTATLYHVALVRNSTSLMAFIDGTQIGTSYLISTSSLFAAIASFGIGTEGGEGAGSQMNGWIDEFRVSNVARWTSGFTVASRAYGSEYEHWLYVNSDNKVTFKVSASGDIEDSTVVADSFGAVSTSTWYNVVAWHDTGNFIGVSLNLHVNTASYAGIIREGSSPFLIGGVSNGVSAYMDGRIDETGVWKKVLSTQERSDLYNLGSGNTYQTAFGPEPWASFDFGATSIRWLTVAAGTGVYASSNLGVTWVNIATDRTATYQYLDRSKNVLVATSDRYDTPLAWSGSANTFATILNPSAPLAKYSINFNGYLILLNTQARKRGFFYEDENTQLTGAWTSNFDIPSTQDDEITSAFILRRYLYISTRYYLYRVSFVGGNPDFSYLKVKDWGYVPRTVKFIYLEGVGQIVTGLCWDQKIRVFDGSDDKIISGNVEEDNGECEFGLSKLGRAGSDLIISFAETDYNENVYKLVVAMGRDSSQTTHMLNFDGRSQAFYPYARQHYNTMVMAESGNQRYLMAFDRSGRCHMLNSGNIDGNTTPVDDFMDTALIFEKSPSQSHKSHETHLFFSNLTCGRIYYQDRIDFGVDWNTRKTFVISGSDRKLQHHEVIDIPEGYNVIQGRITSSSSTSDPWRLNRVDHFTQGLGIGKNQ